MSRKMKMLTYEYDNDYITLTREELKENKE